MDLKVKDIPVIILSVMVVFILGYTYVLTENYIFGEVLSEYLPETAVLILRIIYTGMMIKMVCDASKVFMEGVNDVELQRLKAATEGEEEDKPNKEDNQD